jgi:hypothetical protein
MPDEQEAFMLSRRRLQLDAARAGAVLVAVASCDTLQYVDTVGEGDAPAAGDVQHAGWAVPIWSCEKFEMRAGAEIAACGNERGGELWVCKHVSGVRWGCKWCVSGFGSRAGHGAERYCWQGLARQRPVEWGCGHVRFLAMQNANLYIYFQKRDAACCCGAQEVRAQQLY